MWFNLLLIAHVLLAVGIVGLVLLQQGKGAEMGASFGGGASGSVFGATGSANFLSRTTAILVTLFFASSLALAYIASNKPGGSGAVEEVLTAPAAPPPAVQTPGSPPAGEAGTKADEIPK
jgi:preprotein translocase subunit SecG